MAALLLGGAALALGLWLLRLFASAPVETIRKALVWGAATLAVVLGAGLLFSGRGMQAIWAAGLFAPAIWRWWKARGFSGRFWPGGGAAAGTAGQETAVETAWLAMRLDHASGEMSGRVRQGRFAGQELAELDLPELLALLAECRTQDTESLPLLEAWLDRARPDWRTAEAGPDPAQPTPATGMDRAEALAVLGLAESATREEIRAAHRRLMQAAHPDHGGSDWLAARVNQARDYLMQ